ncbi:MAG: hypothetical protein KJO95_05765 [Gammaproteobacteria bacterium]|nr:hypothetical protein [Gammaproteobacteria bacterium]MBU2676014.1 hypothetical protein [Gammaproteobacteria bacterium]NNC56107.1 hypothetical protein [Woeseiaceae bacterium]NNL49750.1 hypothetical protein [Woeseiaceae bacterium]
MKKIILGTTALLVLSTWYPAATLAQSDDSILSDAHIVNQEFVTAEIIRVKPLARTITVKGDQRGQTRQFTVPANARVTVEGKEARLRDLRRGDKIMIRFTQSPDQVVVTQIRMPDPVVSLQKRRAEPVAEAQPATLPSTASSLPAILLLGLISLGGAGLLRRLRA